MWALYSHTSRIGGAEVAAPRLASALGAELWIRGEGEIADRAQEIGVCTSILPVRADRRPRGVMAKVLALSSILIAQFDLWKKLRGSKPGILISNTLQGALHATIPARITRTPLIVYVRDLGDGGNRPRAEINLYRVLLRLATGVVFNSELTRSSWQVAVPSLVVRSAIDERYFASRVGAERSGAVMIGRIARWKGQVEVVSAFNLLAVSTPIRLTLVGDRAFGDDVELPEARFPLCEVGFQDPIEYLDAAELLVHASTTPEPLGQVLIQAAAAGVPIVCSREGGHTEWLTDGQSCTMVDAHSPSAIASGVRAVLDDPESAGRRAAVARELAIGFHPQVAYREFKEWISDIESSMKGAP